MAKGTGSKGNGSSGGGLEARLACSTLDVAGHHKPGSQNPRKGGVSRERRKSAAYQG